MQLVCLTKDCQKKFIEFVLRVYPLASEIQHQVGRPPLPKALLCFLYLVHQVTQVSYQNIWKGVADIETVLSAFQQSKTCSGSTVCYHINKDPSFLEKLVRASAKDGLEWLWDHGGDGTDPQDARIFTGGTDGTGIDKIRKSSFYNWAKYAQNRLNQLKLTKGQGNYYGACLAVITSLHMVLAVAVRPKLEELNLALLLLGKIWYLSKKMGRFVADRLYYTTQVVNKLLKWGMEPVILPEVGQKGLLREDSYGTLRRMVLWLGSKSWKRWSGYYRRVEIEHSIAEVKARIPRLATSFRGTRAEVLGACVVQNLVVLWELQTGERQIIKHPALHPMISISK